MAVTTPSFSVFEGVPRTQTLINIARSHHFNERLTNAGLPVVPHIYAQTPLDWDRWATFLVKQSHIKMVAMEFQTGLLKRQLGENCIEQLRLLQERTGRDLFLIAIGGARYTRLLEQAFQDRFLIVDSMPFMKAMHRRGANVVGGLKESWIKRNTAVGAPLDALLLDNILRYEERLIRRLSCPRSVLLAAA
jgi:hypothetical protein